MSGFGSIGSGGGVNFWQQNVDLSISPKPAYDGVEVFAGNNALGCTSTFIEAIAGDGGGVNQSVVSMSSTQASMNTQTARYAASVHTSVNEIDIGVTDSVTGAFTDINQSSTGFSYETRDVVANKNSLFGLSSTAAVIVANDFTAGTFSSVVASAANTSILTRDGGGIFNAMVSGATEPCFIGRNGLRLLAVQNNGNIWTNQVQTVAATPLPLTYTKIIQIYDTTGALAITLFGI